MAMSRLAVAAVLFVVSAMLPTPGTAQDKFPWVEKTVWAASYIETMPGKFNDYIKSLSKNWLRYVERLKQDGHVVSYKIMHVEFARDNEPDVVLLVEYKNMAAFDVGTAYWESIVKEIAGSIPQDSKEAVSREQLRKLRGTVLYREIDFAK